MKVVLFTPGLGIGGIERVFINYANMLNDDGIEITYLVCSDFGIFQSLISPNIRVYDLNCGQLRRSVIPMIKFFREYKPDYIMCANSSTLFVLLAKTFANSAVKIISSQHNHINVDTTSFVERNLNWILYNFCYKVIAISDGIYNLMISKGVKKSKIIKIPNPIDLNRVLTLSKDSDVNIPKEKYILYAGRLSKVKNLSLLVYAFSKLNCGYNLVIAGDGPEMKSIQDLVGDLNISTKVRFVGSISNPYPLIKEAGLVCLCSLSEAYPTILVEALYLGKTIVSTPNPGAIEILRNGELGYLSEDFSVGSYINTMNMAIKNPLDAISLKQKAMDYYNPKKFIKRLKTIIK